MVDRPSATVRLCALRSEPLSISEVTDAVADPAAGGVAVFVGAVRDHDEGKSVDRLNYTAHPTAAAELERVTSLAAQRFPVVAVAAVHRLGDLQIGDLAVVVAASSAHRDDAFDAARWLIDELKRVVPIWKEQHFADGTTEWVGTP